MIWGESWKNGKINDRIGAFFGIIKRIAICKSKEGGVVNCLHYQVKMIYLPNFLFNQLCNCDVQFPDL